MNERAIVLDGTGSAARLVLLLHTTTVLPVSIINPKNLNLESSREF